jgi:putative pyruvate formate lyase activating enzyme
VACRGVLVRHLVMPGQRDESKAILHWLADEISPDTYVNIMGQYHPAHEVGRVKDGNQAKANRRYEEINRRPSYRELESAHQAACEAGLWRFA